VSFLHDGATARCHSSKAVRVDLAAGIPPDAVVPGSKPQVPAAAEPDERRFAMGVLTTPERDRESRRSPVVRNLSGFLGSALGIR
jgi:hypothetical protein